MDALFQDRRAAGRQLAGRLQAMRLADPVVLALPRGGVPVAAEVAQALGAPLDLVVVRKIGAPAQRELAVAAIADGAGDEPVVDPRTALLAGAGADYIARQAEVERRELARRRATYLQDRPPLPLAGRTAIVVDDGIATGTTLRAALQAVRRRGAARVVVAVPVAPWQAVEALRGEVDELICLAQPADFQAVGAHYVDFHEVPDEEVLALLRAHQAPAR